MVLLKLFWLSLWGKCLFESECYNSIDENTETGVMNLYFCDLCKSCVYMDFWSWIMLAVNREYASCNIFSPTKFFLVNGTPWHWFSCGIHHKYHQNTVSITNHGKECYSTTVKQHKSCSVISPKQQWFVSKCWSWEI